MNLVVKRNGGKLLLSHSQHTDDTLLRGELTRVGLRGCGTGKKEMCECWSERERERERERDAHTQKNKTK